MSWLLTWVSTRLFVDLASQRTKNLKKWCVRRDFQLYHPSALLAKISSGRNKISHISILITCKNLTWFVAKKFFRSFIFSEHKKIQTWRFAEYCLHRIQKWKNKCAICSFFSLQRKLYQRVFNDKYLQKQASLNLARPEWSWTGTMSNRPCYVAIHGSVARCYQVQPALASPTEDLHQSNQTRYSPWCKSSSLVMVTVCRKGVFHPGLSVADPLSETPTEPLVAKGSEWPVIGLDPQAVASTEWYELRMVVHC